MQENVSIMGIWCGYGAKSTFNLSRNSLKEKCYFLASSSLKIKYGKLKGMQEKET